MKVGFHSHEKSKAASRLAEARIEMYHHSLKGRQPNSCWLKISSCRTVRQTVSTRLRCVITATPEREFVRVEKERKGPTVLSGALP